MYCLLLQYILSRNRMGHKAKDSIKDTAYFSPMQTAKRELIGKDKRKLLILM